jgi:PTH1 family peptidyl-tRNA hydrolase
VKLIVGLGNPGRIYRYTKHNVGFLVIEELAKENRIKVTTKRYGSLLGRGKISGEDVILLMPVTYMNMSGKAVEEAVETAGMSLKDLLVICDDINLRLGTIRMRMKGSAGGHKGMASIMAGLGTDEFARLRVGIATDLVKGDITDYVLSPFKKKDRKKIKEVVKIAKDAIALWVRSGSGAVMSKYNVRNRTYV